MVVAIAAGLAGNALVKLNVFNVEFPHPFVDWTLIGKAVIPVPTPAKFTVITFVLPPDSWLTPVGNVHIYDVAVADAVAVKVSSVLVPIKGPTAAIAVVGVALVEFVITKAAGAVGNTLVKASVLAKLKHPVAFSDRTPMVNAGVIPAETFAKLTETVLVPCPETMVAPVGTVHW